MKNLKFSIVLAILALWCGVAPANAASVSAYGYLDSGVSFTGYFGGTSLTGFYGSGGEAYSSRGYTNVSTFGSVDGSTAGQGSGSVSGTVNSSGFAVQTRDVSMSNTQSTASTTAQSYGNVSSYTNVGSSSSAFAGSGYFWIP